jgi:hypothetical protein
MVRKDVRVMLWTWDLTSSDLSHGHCHPRRIGERGGHMARSGGISYCAVLKRLPSPWAGYAVDTEADGGLISANRDLGMRSEYRVRDKIGARCALAV